VLTRCASGVHVEGN